MTPRDGEPVRRHDAGVMAIADREALLQDRLHVAGAPGSHDRARFRDGLARSSSATTIHVDDVPALARFSCPNGYHLDYRDAEKFTRALGEQLVRRGVIEP